MYNKYEEINIINKMYKSNTFNDDKCTILPGQWT